ncbi:unnamed protein product, partial [Allacma fusca]
KNPQLQNNFSFNFVKELRTEEKSTL